MENRDFRAGKRRSVEKRPYQTTAENSQSSSFVLENSPTQSLAESRDGKTSNAELLRELTRAKVAFQLRAIKAVLGEVG